MLKFEKKSKQLKSGAARPAKFGQKLKAFGKDNEGVAAVEFAILTPVMIALYFGLVEIAMIINADKLTSHATNVVGDLATQVSNMDADDVEDVFEATLATMSLRDTQASNVGIELLSYRMLPDGTIEQIGRATLNNGYTGAAYNPVDIGPRLLTTTSGAVVARVQYRYESVTYKFVERLTTLDETFILKPRSSSDIPFSLDGSPGTFTCRSTGSIAVSCST